MISQTEIDKTAKKFGTPHSQILRDHLISHVIAALADWPNQQHITFFGGTALCRTWLPDLRLSEDIDLLLDRPDDTTGIRHNNQLTATSPWSLVSCWNGVDDHTSCGDIEPEGQRVAEETLRSQTSPPQGLL